MLGFSCSGKPKEKAVLFFFSASEQWERCGSETHGGEEMAGVPAVHSGHLGWHFCGARAG